MYRAQGATAAEPAVPPAADEEEEPATPEQKQPAGTTRAVLLALGASIDFDEDMVDSTVDGMGGAKPLSAGVSTWQAMDPGGVSC